MGCFYINKNWKRIDEDLKKSKKREKENKISIEKGNKSPTRTWKVNEQ